MASERQENSPDNPWWGEHVHRYQLVNFYVPANSTILDIACGTGFGSHLLAKQGYQVHGADLSKSTIDLCQKAFKWPSLQFLTADATALPFPDAYFDAVISFETIEHTTQYEKVLQEFKRVLKPGGRILISTPNIRINSPDGVVRNPYHTQEWNYEELKALLKSVYQEAHIYGQQYKRYKQTKGLRYFIGKRVEQLFYLRGVRKLPLSLQNLVMQTLISKPMYPLTEDYALVEDLHEINSCKTFVAVCRP